MSPLKSHNIYRIHIVLTWFFLNKPYLTIHVVSISKKLQESYIYFSDKPLRRTFPGGGLHGNVLQHYCVRLDSENLQNNTSLLCSHNWKFHFLNISNTIFLWHTRKPTMYCDYLSVCKKKMHRKNSLSNCNAINKYRKVAQLLSQCSQSTKQIPIHWKNHGSNWATFWNHKKRKLDINFFCFQNHVGKNTPKMLLTALEHLKSFIHSNHLAAHISFPCVGAIRAHLDHFMHTTDLTLYFFHTTHLEQPKKDQNRSFTD